MDERGEDDGWDVIDVSRIDMGQLRELPDSVLFTALRRVVREHVLQVRPISTFHSAIPPRDLEAGPGPGAAADPPEAVREEAV